MIFAVLVQNLFCGNLRTFVWRKVEPNIAYAEKKLQISAMVVPFWKEDCSRIAKMTSPCVKITNTKIQLHKYINTAYDKVPERPNMWYILKRGLFKGIKNHIPMCQMRKYTNTQKQDMTKCQNYIHMCPIHKYKNENTKIQIQKYSIWRTARKTQYVVYFWKMDYSRIWKIQHMPKCQKDATCGIYLKRGLFKGITNYIPIQHKLEHLSFAKL